MPKTIHDDGEFFDLELSAEECFNVKLDLECNTIKALCSRYFFDENSVYLNKIEDTFEKTRSEVCLGQEHVSQFIEFCKDRKEFSPDFWKLVSKQMRYFRL